MSNIRERDKQIHGTEIHDFTSYINSIAVLAVC